MKLHFQTLSGLLNCANKYTFKRTIKGNVKCFLFDTFLCIFNDSLNWTLRGTLKSNINSNHEVYLLVQHQVHDQMNYLCTFVHKWLHQQVQYRRNSSALSSAPLRATLKVQPQVHLLMFLYVNCQRSPDVQLQCTLRCTLNCTDKWTINFLCSFKCPLERNLRCTFKCNIECYLNFTFYWVHSYGLRIGWTSATHV